MDLNITLNVWLLLMFCLVLLLLGVIVGAKLRTWAERAATAMLLVRSSPPQLRGWNPGPWKVRHF